MSITTDVIVIGAGGGGAVAAKELGEAGVKVFLLEAGPWYGNKKWPDPNTDHGAVSSSSIDDLSIEQLKKSFTDLEDDMNNSLYGKFRWGPANRQKGAWLRKISKNGFAWQCSGIGGTTLHFWANSPRAYPEAVDNVWPISYQELVPYYEKVERTLPVADALSTPKEDLFYYGLRKSGWSSLDSPEVVTPGYRAQPNAILRPNFHGDDTTAGLKNAQPLGCTLRGHCMNGCYIGPTVEGVAKRSTLVSYIPEALRTGNVEIRPNVFVIKIIAEEDNENGLHAVGVLYKDTWTGDITEVRAKVLVLSAGGIESPRLWLNSELPHNEWVGKGLVNHWFDCVSGIFDESVLHDILGVPVIPPYVGQVAAARFDHPGLGAVETFGLSPGSFSSTLYGSSNTDDSSNNPPSTQKPWDLEGKITGEKLKQFMLDYPRTLSLLILTDDEISQDNGVTLDPEIKDEYGYIPIVKYIPSAATEEKRNRLAIIATEILRNAGAKTITRSNWTPNIFSHIVSTMRMGYVTDTNCEAKQVKRLFIADNSVLYNGIGGPNPTLTAQALATRTAEKIVEMYFTRK